MAGGTHSPEIRVTSPVSGRVTGVSSGTEGDQRASTFMVMGSSGTHAPASLTSPQWCGVENGSATMRPKDRRVS